MSLSLMPPAPPAPPSPDVSPSPPALKIESAPNCTISSISSLVSLAPGAALSAMRPCCTTTASSFSFIHARSMIFSSTLPDVTSRYTRTGLVCPMRCARSMACRSACGFQSLSYRMTTSAVCRLMPSPPARVDSRNANFSLPGALKPSMAASRSS